MASRRPSGAPSRSCQLFAPAPHSLWIEAASPGPWALSDFGVRILNVPSGFPSRDPASQARPPGEKPGFASKRPRKGALWGLSRVARLRFARLVLQAPGPGPSGISGATRAPWDASARRGEEERVDPFRRDATKRGAQAAASLRVAAGPGVFFVGAPFRAPGTATSRLRESAPARQATRREPPEGQTPCPILRPAFHPPLRSG